MNRDKKSQTEFNLNVLQRSDKEISSILYTTSHVTLFALDENFENWKRKDIKGPLFVVKRRVPPHYQIIILNRLNTDIVVDNITKDMKIEETADLFVYQNSKGEVIGVWFYEATERPQFVQLIRRLIDELNKDNVVADIGNVQRTQSTSTSQSTQATNSTPSPQPTQVKQMAQSAHLPESISARQPNSTLSSDLSATLPTESNKGDSGDSAKQNVLSHLNLKPEPQQGGLHVSGTNAPNDPFATPMKMMPNFSSMSPLSVFIGGPQMNSNFTTPQTQLPPPPFFPHHVLIPPTHITPSSSSPSPNHNYTSLEALRAPRLLAPQSSVLFAEHLPFKSVPQTSSQSLPLQQQQQQTLPPTCVPLEQLKDPSIVMIKLSSGQILPSPSAQQSVNTLPRVLPQFPLPSQSQVPLQMSLQSHSQQQVQNQSWSLSQQSQSQSKEQQQPQLQPQPQQPQPQPQSQSQSKEQQQPQPQQSQPQPQPQQQQSQAQPQQSQPQPQQSQPQPQPQQQQSQAQPQQQPQSHSQSQAQAQSQPQPQLQRQPQSHPPTNLKAPVQQQRQSQVPMSVQSPSQSQVGQPITSKSSSSNSSSDSVSVLSTSSLQRPLPIFFSPKPKTLKPSKENQSFLASQSPTTTTSTATVKCPPKNVRNDASALTKTETTASQHSPSKSETSSQPSSSLTMIKHSSPSPPINSLIVTAVDANRQPLASHSSSSVPPSLSPSVTITKQQLQSALLKLVQDERFIDLIYNEYLVTTSK